jgi:hypothetical protein
MKYLCMAYYDEKKFEALSATEMHALVSQCPAHDEALRNTGHLTAQASLGPARSAKVIRPRNGKPAVTDGPYAETKEMIGGFFIIEAQDADEAVRIASKHPAALLGEHVGWGIEVRPIEAECQYKKEIT